MAEPKILFDLAAQGGRVHPLLAVGGDPADGVGTESEQISGFLNPCVRLHRRVNQQSPFLARQTLLSHVPRGLGRASGDETDEVRHVAAADQQPAAPGGKPDQFGNPPHRLPLDLGGERRQPPHLCLVGGDRREIAEHPDGAGLEVT